MGPVDVEGQVTFFDSRPYSPEEAFDTINIVLAMRGFRMMDDGRFLRLVPLADLGSQPVPIVSGLDNTKQMRNAELVTVLLPLKYLQPSEAQQLAVPMAHAYGKVAALAKSKGLLITDEVATIQRIGKMLELLDTGDIAQDVQVRAVELKHAAARDVARVITELWGRGRAPQQPNPPQPQPPQAAAQQTETIRVTYDDRTNIVVLMGESGALLMATEMIGRLDRDQGALSGDTRVFQLTTARAEDLARTLQETVQNQQPPQGPGGRDMATRIVADPTGNRLVVSAPVDQMAKIEALIEKLDSGKETEVAGVRTFRMKVADARQLVSVIHDATNHPNTRGTPQVPLTVSAEARSNTLIVAGSAADIKTAAALVEELDQVRPEQALEVRVIHVETSDIRPLAQSLINVLNKEGTGPGGPNIRIESDRSSNNLIVAAPPAEWPRIETILKDIKQATVEQTAGITRLLPLKHASARDMAKALDPVFSRRDRAGNNRADIALPVVISASEQANALLISASKDDLDRITQLVTEMDVEGQSEAVRITTIEMTAADAQKVAETLRAMLPKAANGTESDVAITADAQTNAVLIRAPENQRKMLEEMISHLDKPIAQTARQTLVHPLANASATAVSAVLTQLYPTPSSSAGGPSSGGPRPGSSGEAGISERIVITAAPGDKALVIDAPRQKIDRIVQLADSLDSEGEVAGRLTPRSYILTNANARDLAQSLSKLFAERRTRQDQNDKGNLEPEPRFEAEEASNLLLVAATSTQYEIIDKLIQQLETDSVDRQVQVRLFALKQARAADIEPTVEAALSTRAGLGTQDARQGARPGRISVSTDERTNVLIVTAPSSLMKEAETLITRLDTADGTESAVTTEVVTLAHADAEEMATALNAALAGQEIPGRGGQQPQGGGRTAPALKGRNVRVVPNAGARSVLLTGTPSDIAVAKSLVALLDERDGGAKPETKVYKLAHAKADSVRQVLQDTLSTSQQAGGPSRPGRSGQAETPVKVSADPTVNAVVVYATSDVHAQVAALLEQLDSAEAADSAMRIEVVPMMHGKASAMADALNAARGVDPQHRTPGSLSPASAVDPGNCLVITGRPEELAAMKVLVKQLDDAGTKLTGEVKFFPLQHAQAKDLVDVLQSMLGASETSGSSPRGQRRQGSPESTETVVRIAAADATNSLIVQGPPDKLALAEQMIGQLDVVQAAQRTVTEIVRLTNAQASSLAEAVNGMLGGSQQGSSGPNRQGAPQGGQQSGLSETETVTVTPETNSNSVLVRGPATRVSEVVATIRQLDGTGTSNLPQMRTYKLANNDAKEVSDSLGQLFRDMIKQIPASGGPGHGSGSSSSATTPFSIGVDIPTNTLVVSTTPAYFSMFEQLLNQIEHTEVPLREVYYVPLINADAYELSKKLDSLFGGRKGPDAPSIETDSYANALTIIAKEMDYRRMLPLIEKIDKMPTRKVQVIPVTNMRAEKLAELLAHMYPQLSDNQLRVVETLPGRGESAEPALPPAQPVETPAAPPAAPTTVSPARAGPASAPTAAPAILRADETRGQVPPPAASAPATAPAAAVTPPVLVAVDKRANTLIVSGTQQEIDAIKELATQLSRGEESADTEIRWFPLQHADPQAVAATLEKLFNPQQAAAAAAAAVAAAQAPKGKDEKDKGQQPSQPAPPPAPAAPAKIIVVPEMRTRNLIVKAKAADFDLIEPTIKRLDQMTGGAETEVHTFPLVNTEATEVAANLRELFRLSSQGGNAIAINPQQLRAEDLKAILPLFDASGNPLPADSLSTTVVTANRATNSVVVSGPRQIMSVVADVIKELDQSVGKSTRPVIRMYPTTVDDVAGLAATLSRTFAGVDLMQPGRIPTLPVGRQETPVVVTADEAARLLIVSASAEQHEMIDKIIKQVQSAQTDGGGTTKVIQLHNGKAVEVAKTLTVIADTKRTATPSVHGGAAGPAVTVAAEVNSNSIILSGPAAAVEKFAGMIDQLEKANTQTAEGTFILPLERAKAAQVAEMVLDLHRQQLAAAQRTQREVPPLAVTPDDRSNTLVLICSPERFKEVATWVNQVEQMNPKQGTPRIIQLENVDPNELEGALRKLYGSSSGAGAPGGERRGGERRGGETSGAGALPFTVSVLPAQRQLLVDASQEDLKVIQDLVKALEGAAKTQKPEIRLFELKNADSTRTADSLRQIFTNIKRPNFAEDNVTITALPKTKAVMVAAVAEKMADAERLIKELDTPTISPAMDFRVWPLQYTSPANASSLLNKMLDEYRKQHPDEPISVVVDERTRSLIVSAQTSMFEQIDKLIARIDERPKFGDGEVLIVPLMRADAPTLAAVLNEMLQPSKTGQVTDEARALQEQVKLLHVRTLNGEALPELDLTKPIKIQASPTQSGQQGNNSLVITSTPENNKALAAVVKLMDAVPVTEAIKVRLIVLRNGDAEAVKKVLDDAFSQGAKQLAGRPNTTLAGKAEPAEGDGKALVKPLTCAIDVRTNAIVLSGAPDTLELAERLVQDLDRDSGKFVTEVRLFKLQNADAARLAPMLQAVFSETGATGSGPAATGAEGVRTYVTRLVIKQPNGQLLPSEYPKARPALALQADSGTNTLIVAARGDVMPIIADVITSMDIPGAGTMNTVRIFPLVNADASRLSNVISGLYTGLNAALVRLEDKPTVQVDTRTNSLIVSASDKTFAMITALLEKLDAKMAVDLHEVRLISVANSDAEALAATMQKLMDARVQRQKDLGSKDAEALRVMVLADPRSNSLIVGGSAESFELIKGLADRLDVAAPALSGQIQVMPLANASAGTLATTLSTLFDRRYQAVQGKGGDTQRQKPVILSDQRTNSLLVAANQEDSQIVKSLLEKLDTKPTDPAMALVVIPLEHNDAGIVGPMIKRLFDARQKSTQAPGQQPSPQDQVDVETDALANAMIVSASRENLALIHTLLGKVDVAPPVANGIVRMYALENADAVRIAGMLDSLVSKGLYKPGVGLANPAANSAAAAHEKVSIVADDRTNVLVISASKENFVVLEDVIKRLDTPEAKGQMSSIRMYTMQHANADRLAPSLQKFFDAKRTAEIATQGDKRTPPLQVNFTGDPRTNTILVSGGPESFNAVEAMIEKLDAEDVVPTAIFRVFRLQYASAANISDQIQKLFAGRPKAQGKELDPVTVVNDKKSNVLMVGATTEDMQMAENLITQLDQKVDTDQTQRIFPIKKADAKKVGDTIKNLYTGMGGMQDSGVSISVDDWGQKIVVSAPQDEMDRIAGIIKTLDDDKSTNVTEIRVFPLRNADANELADTLIKTLTKKPESPASQQVERQTLLQFIRNMPGGQRLVTQALQEGILITPNRRANALVVTAPVDELELLKNLIEALDSVAPRASIIKSFVLVNADASQMALTLKDLFRLDSAGSTRSTRSGGGGSSAGSPGSNGGSGEMVTYTMTNLAGEKSSATIGTAADVALTITADPRTNTLLVGGTDQHVRLASRVIEQLDSYPAQERICRIYRLRNVQATEIETAMKKWLDEEHKRLTESMGTDNLGAVQRLLEREVSVVAVTTSNDVSGSTSQPSNRPSYNYGTGSSGTGPSAQLQSSGQSSNVLLVSASSRYFDNVMEMIQELDEPPPQVLIDVLMAEVTLDDQMDLGAGWQYQNTFHANTFSGVSGTNINGVGSTTVGGGATPTNVPNPAAISSVDNGFNLSVTGGNLQFFLRALESQGRMRVLNRPQILAIDNQVARIQSGQQVPIPEINYYYGTANPTTSYNYRDVGIILEVVPRISPDGFVRMDVHPEISSISANATSAQAPTFNNRSATTTITVKDGHSIVVGGLITTSDQSTESKVPGLGDIPILGWLFKSATVAKNRTELLIILTPRIIRTVPEADLATDQEARRTRMLGGQGCQSLMETLYNPLESGPKMRLDGVHWGENPKNCDTPPLKPAQVPATQPARDGAATDSRLQPVKDLRW